MTTADKILKDLDKALSSLDKPDFDMEETAVTIQKACKFLVAVIDQSKRENEELSENLRDAEEAINALAEENEILQVDIQLILGFLKKNKIDISYIVTKSDTAKKVKKGKPPE